MDILYVSLICVDDEGHREEFTVGEFFSYWDRDVAIKVAEEKIIPLAENFYREVKLVTSSSHVGFVNENLLKKEFWLDHVNEEW